MSTNEPLTISEAAEALGLPKATLRHILQRPDRRARLLHAYRNSKKGLKTVELVPVDLLDELSRAFPAAEGGPAADIEIASDEGEDIDSDVSPESVNAADPACLSSGGDDGESVPELAATQASLPGADSVESADAPEPLADIVVDSASDPESSAAPDDQTSLVEPSEIKHGSVNQQTGDAMMIVATYERLLAEREARLLEMHAALESERTNGRRLAEALSASREALAHAQECLTIAQQLRAETTAAIEAERSATQADSQSAESVPVATSGRGFWARIFSR